jgi:hypothetical protein
MPTENKCCEHCKIILTKGVIWKSLGEYKHFCSGKCFIDYKVALYKVSLENLMMRCKFCKVPVTDETTYYLTKNNYFCSEGCYEKYKEQQRANWLLRATQHCRQCRKELNLENTFYATRWYAFCSADCFSKYKEHNYPKSRARYAALRADPAYVEKERKRHREAYAKMSVEDKKKFIDKAKAYGKEYRVKNREKIRVRATERNKKYWPSYYVVNKEKEKERSRQWYITHATKENWPSCTIAGCTRPAYCKKLCSKHYQAARVIKLKKLDS